MRSITGLLSRGTVALEIDHHTVHHAPNTASVHLNEKDENGATIRGQDVDGVTVEDLGSTGEIATAITGAKLAKFIGDASGLPTTVAVKPPEPKKEEAPAQPAAAAPSAP